MIESFPQDHDDDYDRDQDQDQDHGRSTLIHGGAFAALVRAAKRIEKALHRSVNRNKQ